MPKTDRFFIGQTRGSGMQTNLKPFAIPDDAYEQLSNAYLFRGRVRKRFGSRLMQGVTSPAIGYESLQSRLRIKLGTTNGLGNISGTVAGNVFQVMGQIFSVGDEIFTCNVVGTPANLISTGAGTGTYNTTTGAFVIAGAAATDAYFYPSQPVMGIANYESGSTVNDEPVLAFDTQFAYQFTTDAWQRLGTAIWTGTNADYFWTTNWRGANSSDSLLFVTNFNNDDRIQYYNADATPVWASMAPVCNNIFRLLTARIILPFKDRLVMFNTVEEDVSAVSPSTTNRFSPANSTNASTGDFNQTQGTPPYGAAYAVGDQFIVGNTIFVVTSIAAGLQPMTVYTLAGVGTPPTAQFNAATGNLVITGNNTNLNLGVYYFSATVVGTETKFPARCRFSLNGNPTSANGWIDQTSGLGGYIDAPTKEAIVTAQFLKDRLIVYFESSTWELVYIGNQTLPFVWQQINTELGAESTLSQVPFDKAVLGVGNVGIHACNGANVERIDDKIPDVVFNIHNENNGVLRVAGIRDYYVEMVYWTFPSVFRSTAFPFNNKVLVYNYKSDSWAFNDDSITVFGYYQASINEGETWASDMGTWETDNSTWTDGTNVQAKFKAVIAGNQQGFVFIVDPDTSRNAPALSIANMTFATPTITISCINHNLLPGFNGQGDYIIIENVQGVTGVNGVICAVNSIIDENTFTVLNINFAGMYTGGGTIARVSNINILTKQYNFYAQQGMNASINKVDFLVDKTSDGEITVDYYIATSNESSLLAGAITGSLLGNGTLETKPYTLMPAEQNQTQLWHPIYPLANGEYIQLNIYMDENQLTDSDIAFSDFQLHAMNFYAQGSGRLQ